MATLPAAFASELEFERWQHAACLTLAEGSKDYPPEHLQSEAMRAVISLREQYDFLFKYAVEMDAFDVLRGYAAFLNSCAASSERAETLEWYIKHEAQNAWFDKHKTLNSD